MISQKYVYEIIDNAEVSFRKCAQIFMMLKSRNIVIENILEFQPTLASVLFNLDRLYREIIQEEKKIISRKDRLSTQWFVKRLKSLNKYKECIKTTIRIGKVLGDSFAWSFYLNDRQQLDKHMKHEKIFHTPPGIGGMGEIEFIKNTQLIGEHLVIYHGITNFLRVGDVSLFNLKTGKVDIIGEIKTKSIGERELSITLHMIGKVKPKNLKIEIIQDSKKDNSIDYFTKNRLKKQIEEMKSLFKYENPESKKDIMNGYHIKELKNLANYLDKERYRIQQIGDGLLVIGLVNNEKSLSLKLSSTSKSKLNNILKVATESLKALLKENSDYNSIHYGLYDFEYLIGGTPFLWWPLKDEHLIKILFHEIVLITLYNPAHFIKKFIDLGCNIEPKNNGRSYKANLRINDRTLSFEGFEYYFYAIQKHFMNENAIIDTLKWVINKAKDGEIQDNARVELSILHNLF